MSGPISPRDDGFHEALSYDYEERYPNVIVVISGEARLTEQEGTLQSTIDAFIERVNDVLAEEGIDWWVDTAYVKEDNA